MRTLPRDCAPRPEIWLGGEGALLAFLLGSGPGFLLLGYRAVPLKNNYSEDLELASLLVKVDVFPAKVPAARRGGASAGPASR